ncbi:MAG: hypothetical protein HC830_07245 [Bacteroidetes bacterium]|nr:hypothetical protein [Bacteroidota bacterium]
MKDTVMLNAVVVKAIRLPNKVEDGHFRAYSTPDKVFEITNKDYGYGNVADYIKDYLKGKILWAPTATFADQSGEPLILMDNVIVDKAVLKATPLTQVYKIEVLKYSSTSQFGARGANGVISILLKRAMSIPNL